MPSDEALLQQAQECKAKGNAAFGKGDLDAAISAYAQGIVACDRLLPSTSLSVVKTTLLSNRAMCYLKQMKLQDAIDDCTSALALDPEETTVRAKLWFRRAKATYLQGNLQDAAKDLLALLQIDANNKDANELLKQIRVQHKGAATTPVSKALEALTKGTDVLHNLKLIMGMIDNDLAGAAMELGRLHAVDILFQIANESSGKTACFAVQCVASSANHPAFVRAYLKTALPKIADLLKHTDSPELIVSFLGVLVRIILHLDRDDANQDISDATLLEYDIILQICISALAVKDTTTIRAVMDVLSTWTAGVDRDAVIRASLDGVMDATLPLPVTKAQFRLPQT
jgi:tetratricopeptide (TPR) repeat protein